MIYVKQLRQWNFVIRFFLWTAFYEWSFSLVAVHQWTVITPERNVLKTMMIQKARHTPASSRRDGSSVNNGVEARWPRFMTRRSHGTATHTSCMWLTCVRIVGGPVARRCYFRLTSRRRYVLYCHKSVSITTVFTDTSLLFKSTPCLGKRSIFVFVRTLSNFHQF